MVPPLRGGGAGALAGTDGNDPPVLGDAAVIVALGDIPGVLDC